MYIISVNRCMQNSPTSVVVCGLLALWATDSCLLRGFRVYLSLGGGGEGVLSVPDYTCMHIANYPC